MVSLCIKFSLIYSNSNDPSRRISAERLMDPTPLPLVDPSRHLFTEKVLRPGKETKTKKPSKKSKRGYSRPQTYRSSISGKPITMKPSTERFFDPDPEATSSSDKLSLPTRSGTSIVSERLFQLERKLDFESIESQNNKIMDEDLQQMQIELGKSYDLFQKISTKFESIDFGTLHKRIENLHLTESSNDLSKAATDQLKQMFDTSFLKNRLGKLTTEVRDGFRRHPGEFADIPELSNFFQACSQLEHGLETLKKQRKRSNELEDRISLATEMAYNRMEEIRNSLGTDPKKNF